MDNLFESLKYLANQEWIRNLFWTAVLLATTGTVVKLSTKALHHLLQRDNNPLPNASIFINIARAVVWLLGGSIVLDSIYGINASAIIAALGVGGIAISLGFQDTLANLIGGLQVTFMGIVKPGDNIEVGAETGVVQDVSWRHTTIKDSLGQTVIIPNSIISKTALTHLLPATRVTAPFAVATLRTSDDNGTACCNLDVLDQTLREATRAAASAVCPITDDPKVVFSEITELGVKGTVILSVADASLAPAVKDAIIRAIARELS